MIRSNSNQNFHVTSTDASFYQIIYGLLAKPFIVLYVLVIMVRLDSMVSKSNKIIYPTL